MVALDLSVEDLDELSGLFEEPGAEDGCTLRGLTRSISGQYAEVIANYVRCSFLAEDTSLQRVQVEAALSSLQRLAAATDDPELIHALSELERLLPESEAMGGQRRERYLRDMRAWVLRFSELLGDKDGKRLLSLVKFDERSTPLLHRLMEVYGIGPRRLERLYCAGLFSVESLITAEPLEVAQVTGMTEILARSVIHAAKLFDRRRRQLAARALMDRTHDAIALAREARNAGREDPGMLHAMRTSLNELRHALNDMSPEETS